MSDVPRLVIYGGVNTIGGTKVAVQEGRYQVVFDFGMAHAPGGDFWCPRLQPRAGAAGLRDLVTLGYLPPLDGLYPPAGAAGLGLQPGDGEHTHVFISHLHLDHMGLVQHLAPTVPVWLHTDSLRLFHACAATGEHPPVPAGARAFHWHQTIQAGPIRVTPLPVDHDIPGASGLLIETSAGVVAYSGDLRLHGSHPEQTQAFRDLARTASPRILLLEGTRLGEPPPTAERPGSLPEEAVAEQVAALLAACPGLGIISLYPRNVERIGRIAAAAKVVGRRLVLAPEAAYLFWRMGGSPAEADVYLRDCDQQACAAGQAAPWFRQLQQAGFACVDALAVRRQPQRFLLQLFYWDLGELVDLRPPAGSRYIHSNGEPLGQYDPAFPVVTRWLNHFGLELHSAWSTGHASPSDLTAIAAHVRPAVLMPIHSHHPDRLEVPGIRRVLPELGAAYAIATGERLA
jgi:ribonuclease J